MKKYIALAAMATAVVGCTSKQESDAMKVAFAEAQAMVDSLRVPQFCADSLNITNFGAQVTADARTNGHAINAAIDSASAMGGACVVVPEGEWLTTPITLKSNVNLVVSENAIIKFSTDYNDYTDVVLTRWEGVDCYNLRPLIYAYDACNIAITGKGVIDGQGSNEVWWYMKGRKKYGWTEGMNSQEIVGRPRLLEADRTELSVEERRMTLDDALRPQLINIYKCESVLIEGVTLQNSPFWVVHPLFVNDLIVRNVTINSAGPNSDGCDPESCANVLIEGCTFNTGDDCIAIKSGRNYDGRRWAAPSRNIYVRNCHMKDGHGGVVLGSEISGGFSNLWVENCTMDSPELERVIRIKTSDCRGGVIENVYVRDLKVGQCQEAILKVNLQYEPNEVCNRDFPPVVRNVNMSNITSSKSKYGAYIVGLEGKQENVDGITIENCNFTGVEDGNNITNAVNVKFDNVLINGAEVK